MSARALDAALRAAFPGAGVAVVPVAEADIATLPLAEQRAVSGAVFARQREFAAGRIAAAKAQADLGLLPQPIPMGPDRAPIWPAGLHGSISHAAGLAAAVVTDQGPVGLDIEECQPLDPELWPTILTGAEMNPAKATENKGFFALQVFVAKEAAYKAQYPLSRALFDFHSLHTQWSGNRFSARFTKAYPPFAAGDALNGQILRIGDLLVAAVQIRL